MRFRKSLSRFQKNFKHKLSKIGDKLEGGDIKDDGGKDDPRLGDSQSVSRSVSGTGYDSGRSGGNASGGEAGQNRLHSDPHTDLEGGSRRDVDGKKADRVETTPSILRGVESQGAWTAPFQSLPLTNGCSQKSGFRSRPCRSNHIQGQIRLETYHVFCSQIIPPDGRKICGRLPSAQIRCWRTLRYPRQLRGMIHLRSLDA